MNNNVTIGIPRALSYHYFGPLWQTFFTRLGFHTKLSTPTDRLKLNAGIKIAPCEACLPLKCYLGHALSLVNDVDFIFIPRLVCLQKKPSIKLGCPKLIGLPDMVKALVPGAPLLTLDIDLRRESDITSYIRMMKRLGCSSSSTKHAYYCAVDELRRYQQQKSKERCLTIDGDKKIKIGILGHAYVLHDDYLNLNLVKKVSNFGGSVVFCHDLPSETLERALAHINPISWFFEDTILGAAQVFHQTNDIAGALYVFSFGCGAASITNEIIELEIRKDATTPLLRIVLDEHTGETGLVTRLESFMDMIRLKDEALI